jgi:hypothetical protein
MSTWRRVAWLKAPSDEEDHATFQLDQLPETYALETSNPIFTLIWHRLADALKLRRRVLPLPSWPNRDVVDYTTEGKVVVRTVIASAVTPRQRKKYDPNDHPHHTERRSYVPPTTDRGDVG